MLIEQMLLSQAILRHQHQEVLAQHFAGHIQLIYKAFVQTSSYETCLAHIRKPLPMKNEILSLEHYLLQPP